MNPTLACAMSPTPELLLEPATVTELLAAAIRWPKGRRPRNLSVDRYWPPREFGFTCKWSFDLGSRRRYSLFATRTEAGPLDLPDDMRRPTLTDRTLRNIRVRMADAAAVVYSPDADPTMPHLSTCLNVTEMAPRLAAADPRLGEASVGRVPPAECRLLAYRPNRRAAVLYRSPGRAAGPDDLIGKTFRELPAADFHDQVTRLNDQLRAISGDRMMLPPLVGRIPELQMILSRRAEGKAPPHPAHWGMDDLQRLAHTLAYLHQTRLELDVVFGPEKEIAVLHRWEAALRQLRPTLADELQPIIESLACLAADVDQSTYVTVHRDFYERQLLFDGDRTYVLDLDTLARGHPCIDLGNLIAHIYLGIHSHDPTASHVDAIVRGLLDQYETAAGRIDPLALQFYTISSLVRVGAVHALRTPTAHLASILWFEASRRLSQTCVWTTQ